MSLFDSQRTIVLACALLAFTVYARAEESVGAASDAVPTAAADQTSVDGPASDTEATATRAEKAPAPPPAPVPIDQQAYRVLVAVGVSSDPSLSGPFGEAVLTGLRDRIASRLGPLWEAEVIAAEWLSPGRQTVLAGLVESDLTARFLESDYDKVFFTTVEVEGAGFRIAAREWDRNSQSATAMTSRVTLERRVLADRILSELLVHFRPFAELESVSEDAQSAEFRIRGGELLPPDPGLRPVAEGMYLRPYLRYLDRKKQLRQLQLLPWTYLQVTSVDRGRMQVHVTSAFSGILAGSRRRTELMAIAVKTRFDHTALQIYPRGQPENPMAAVRIDVLNRRPTAEDAVEDRLTLYTDRAGEVQIPATPEQPLQFIYVLVGKGVLAMVPYISGEHPFVSLDVPDDGPRLAVEGEVAIMEAEVIEVVARREVTIARALGLARGGRWKEADPLIEEIKNLPTRDSLKERLERIRLPAVDAARRTKNRVAESRINQMCRQLVETIDKHLDPDRVRTFLQEVAELKQAG